MQFVDKEYDGTELHVDGNRYEECRLSNCVLVYSGGTPPTFLRCNITGCTLTFNGKAGHTVNFLKSMAAPHSGMQEFVASAIPEIFQLGATK
jgi:hypothetical protein